VAARSIPGVPNKILDDLFASFVLLTGRDEHETAALLDAQWFDARVSGAKFQTWVDALGLEPTFVTDTQSALSRLRAHGGSDSEQLDRLLEWVRASRVSATGSDEQQVSQSEAGSGGRHGGP
jgi:hypothetical protein